MERMNSLHNTIKFTFEWSDTCVNFLDISVLLNNGILSTDLYTKPTDKYQYFFTLHVIHTFRRKVYRSGKPYGYNVFVLLMPF